MTLSDLLSDLYARFGYAASPDAGVTARFTRFCNETQREICADPALQQWLIGTQTFASEADVPQYGLPPTIAKILKITDASNRYALGELSFDQYRTVHADPESPTGTPTHFVQFGEQPVAEQPTAATTFYVKSTSALDTGTAYLEGVRSGGHPFSVSVAMTGTTAAQFSVSDVIEITKFYISAAAVGTVTLQDTL